jgi:hypothetical protein
LESRLTVGKAISRSIMASAAAEGATAAEVADMILT